MAYTYDDHDYNKVTSGTDATFSGVANSPNNDGTSGDGGGGGVSGGANQSADNINSRRASIMGIADDLDPTEGSPIIKSSRELYYRKSRFKNRRVKYLVMIGTICCLLCALFCILILTGIIVVASGHNFCEIQWSFNGGNLNYLYDGFIHAIEKDERYKMNHTLSLYGKNIICTFTTPRMRFVDDITLTFNLTSPTITTIHAYSKSRVGKYDFGQNYRNLQTLLWLTGETDYQSKFIAGC